MYVTLASIAAFVVDSPFGNLFETVAMAINTISKVNLNFKTLESMQPAAYHHQRSGYKIKLKYRQFSFRRWPNGINCIILRIGSHSIVFGKWKYSTSEFNAINWHLKFWRLTFLACANRLPAYSIQDSITLPRFRCGYGLRWWGEGGCNARQMI